MRQYLDNTGTNGAPPLLTRIWGRVRREAKRLELKARKRRSGRDVLWVDCGWVELIFTDDGDDQEILYHLNQRLWHKKETEALSGLIADGATVFDIGANMGFYAAIFAAQTGPGGRVIAFEPSAASFEKLCATTARNKLANVLPLNVGCGASTTTGTLRQVSASSGSATLVGEGAGGETIDLVPLDDIPEARTHPPDLVKIDVEGFEAAVLEGARGILAEHQPVLYIELCGEYADSTRRTVELLDELGYDTEHIVNLDWSTVANGSNFVVSPR